MLGLYLCICDTLPGVTVVTSLGKMLETSLQYSFYLKFCAHAEKLSVMRLMTFDFLHVLKGDLVMVKDSETGCCFRPFRTICTLYFEGDPSSHDLRLLLLLGLIVSSGKSSWRISDFSGKLESVLNFQLHEDQV